MIELSDFTGMSKKQINNRINKEIRLNNDDLFKNRFSSLRNFLCDNRLVLGAASISDNIEMNRRSYYQAYYELKNLAVNNIYENAFLLSEDE